MNYLTVLRSRNLKMYKAATLEGLPINWLNNLQGIQVSAAGEIFENKNKYITQPDHLSINWIHSYYE